jgi:hypothetical protein
LHDHEERVPERRNASSQKSVADQLGLHLVSAELERVAPGVKVAELDEVTGESSDQFR